MLTVENLPKFAIFMGGTSSEREISILSGQSLASIAKRNKLKHEVVLINNEQDIFAWLAQNSLSDDPCKIALIALHGGMGENGQLQAVLEVQKMPYTGSDAKSCFLAMDKWHTKQILKASGVSVPKAILTNPSQLQESLQLPFELPVMVKPVSEGSSVGINKVTQPTDLVPAIKQAFKYEDSVLVEQYIQGKEITVNYIDREIMPLIEIKTNRLFYDYEAKYKSDTTEYICPANLPKDTIKKIKSQTLLALEAMNLSGWGRADFILSNQSPSIPYLLEINTVPGLTSHSLFPMATKEYGMDELNMLLAILQTSDKPNK